jgi:hypothetical protein
MSEMLNRLRNLPSHSVVLFASSFFYDAAGNYFLPEEVLDLICRSSNAPVYSTNEPYLGHGIVGGSLLDLVEPGTAAGILGRRILAGEKPGAILVKTLDPNHIMVDARQLQRWGISESKLPPGSIVKFRQDSAWDVYKWYVVGCFVLFGLQSLLIVTLIVQSRKLKRSEVLLKDLSRHLINAQEEERRRIARELHDDFGQRLALLQIDLESQSQEEGGPFDTMNGPGRWQTLLSNVSELAHDIQDLSHTLHSSKLQYVGLKGALNDLCRQISRLNSAVIFQARLVCASTGWRRKRCTTRPSTVAQAGWLSTYPMTRLYCACLSLTTEKASTRLKLPEDWDWQVCAKGCAWSGEDFGSAQNRARELSWRRKPLSRRRLKNPKRASSFCKRMGTPYRTHCGSKAIRRYTPIRYCVNGETTTGGLNGCPAMRPEYGLESVLLSTCLPHR